MSATETQSRSALSAARELRATTQGRVPFRDFGTISESGSLTRETADLWISTANQLYGEQPHLAREEAVRSVSLAAMVLMLAARNRGFASCPIGFAPNQLREILRTGDRYTPLMMIAVGRDASDSQKRRPRLPLNQILSFDEFGADEKIDAKGSHHVENKILNVKTEVTT